MWLVTKITKINTTLANILEVANALLAWVLIFGCVVGGVYLMRSSGYDDGHYVGGLLGLLVGWIVATIVCGFLALLVNIRNEIKRAADALENAENSSSQTKVDLLD